MAIQLAPVTREGNNCLQTSDDRVEGAEARNPREDRKIRREAELENS